MPGMKPRTPTSRNVAPTARASVDARLDRVDMAGSFQEGRLPLMRTSAAGGSLAAIARQPAWIERRRLVRRDARVGLARERRLALDARAVLQGDVRDRVDAAPVGTRAHGEDRRRPVAGTDEHVLRP